MTGIRGMLFMLFFRISLKVSEKNSRGAMQKSRGQQALERARIIPMLFQKTV